MKHDISMQSVKTLFRLDLRSRFGSAQSKNKKGRVLQAINLLFYAIVYAVVILGVYYLSNIFVARSGLRIEFLVIVATVTMLLATVIATGTVIKNLYMNGDNELLLRFPVNGKEILLSKSIYCFLHNMVVCVLTMLPFYIVFGVVTHAAVGDYFSYIAVTLISTFLPFFIANIIAVPVMKIMNLVKNQFLLILIFTILVICGLFSAYMISLSNVVTYLTESNQNIFSADMIARYQAFARYAYPFNWYAYLINGIKYAGLTSTSMGLSFLYMLLVNVGLGIIAYFVTTREYYKTILYGIETNKASFKKKIPNTARSVFGTLVRREFYLILRSFNYSFQYLAMACAAPLMVFFCNRLAASMGTKSVGAQIVPGLTLMVIVIFITIIVSFASTSVSREGSSFYHTKIIPVSYRTQIATKFFLYAGVATVSVALCCMVSGIYYTSDAGGHLLTPIDVGAIFGISEMLVISLTSLSMWADIKSPTFNVSGDGELVAANKNVALAMFTGIIVSVLYGLFTMLFSFLPLTFGEWEVVRIGHIEDIYSILAVATSLLLVGSVSMLFVNLNKRYQKILP